MAPDFEYIRSRISEFSNSLTTSSFSHDFLQQSLHSLQNNVDHIVSQHSDIASLKDDDLDAFMNSLRNELTKSESETASLSKEIENLKKSCLEGTCQLESNLESLRHALDYAKSEGQGQMLTEAHIDNSKSREDQLGGKAHDDDYFEVLKLKHQLEMNNMELKSWQDLDLNLKRMEVIENIEEALTGLKVIEFEGNIIRVSLRTYIPDVEAVMCELNAEVDTEKVEVNHELSIEVMDETMEIKNVAIFPNDVYIAEIVEDANTFWKVFSGLSAPQTRSSLEWFLLKVQDRIATRTIRQFMVKIANNTRYTFEYMDKEELIIAHIGGIDALIRPSQGWPLSTSPLELISFRSSHEHSFEISSILLSKVEEANSFDVNVRKSITNFVDAIVEMVPDKIRADLHL